MSLYVIRAVQLAEVWHKGQERIGGDSALSHLLEVGGYLETFHAPGMVVAAGILHDLFEDTLCPRGTVMEAFGRVVTDLIVEVTDVYTHKAFPKMPYGERKSQEIARLPGLSRDAKAIKLADYISNARSIGKHDLDFAPVYLDYMSQALPHLAPSYPLLYEYAYRVLQECQSALVQISLSKKPRFS